MAQATAPVLDSTGSRDPEHGQGSVRPHHRPMQHAGVVLRFGLMERPDVPEALRLALAGPPLGPFDPDEATYSFRRETVIPTERVAGMAVWREALFTMLHLNANRAAAYYGGPTARVVEIGIERSEEHTSELQSRQSLVLPL